MTKDTHFSSDGNGTPKVGETPTERLDRLLHVAGARLTGDLSPISLSLALADWAWHLSLSPGRQLALKALAMELLHDRQHSQEGTDADAADEDPRFRNEAWTAWPYSQFRTGFHHAETFWREAAAMPGMTAHHADLTRFFARQWLDMMAPTNWLTSNPVLLQDALDSGGTHLLQGAQNWWADLTGVPTPHDAAQQDRFVVGRDVAVTPGQVVYRNRLIELIRYTPQTERVHPEPVFIVPSWIMKYYILDLSPHNSLVRYLVGQGHVVYMLSWRNPDAADFDLSLDDYLHLGVFDAIKAIDQLESAKVVVHAMGYCLGGTLLSIAAAALAGGASKTHGIRPLKTLTLMAAQTDFSEPGELGLFIDESQISMLDKITRSQGYLSGKQMAGSFQFLHSRELFWTRRVREYIMGEREQPNDLMAWNADTTRMPARMHHEYLTALYLKNALASNRYRVDGQTVSLGDIRQPVFLLATRRDHVSPWCSVYKLHQLCDAEISFVLTSGGHNAGIVSEPGHAQRSYQMATRVAHGAWLEADKWADQAPHYEGSWWPAWQAWLADHSSRQRAVKPIPAKAVLCDAPGSYVLQRYRD